MTVSLSEAENLLEIMLVTHAHKEQASKVVQVDPIDCGCTECGIGMYVPLNYANDEQLLALTMGHLSDATGLSAEGLAEWYFERKRKRSRR
jgi:hypothetical protein